MGRYQVVRELGKGAMGVVYEGLDPNIGRKVAIKTARRDFLEASGRAGEMLERFLREARAAGALNHPNIVTIYDADEENDIAYIAMEFVEGGDLEDLIEKQRRFTPEEVIKMVAPICSALSVAHGEGIVHRDIKPANIMLLNDGTVKIGDFGIARVSDSNLTQEGTVMGTPYYMSPEQVMGQKVDGRSDLFSVGVIIYEMLTGEKPFSGEALSTVMHNVTRVNPVEPKELNFSINDCLNKVVMKTLSKRPGDRYQSGTAMAAALVESLKENSDPAVTGVVVEVEHRATVVSGSDAPTVVAKSTPDVTLPSTSLPTDEPVQAGAQAAQAVPVEVPVKPPRKLALSPAIIGGAALAVIVLVIAGVFWSMSPSVVPLGEPTIAKLDITVYLADTKEALLAAMDEDYTKCNENGKADVTVTDYKTKDVLATLKGIYTERVTLSKPSPHVTIRFEQEGYEPKILDRLASDKPNETAYVVVALAKTQFDDEPQ